MPSSRLSPRGSRLRHHSRLTPHSSLLTAPASRLVRYARIAHLATCDAHGRPHVVPICYVLEGDTLALALDEKPKRVGVRGLRRVRNIRENPAVSVVVDDYAEDWSRLAFVLVHGSASVVEPGEPAHAPTVALLRAKYPQYAAMSLETVSTGLDVNGSPVASSTVSDVVGGGMDAGFSVERMLMDRLSLRTNASVFQATYSDVETRRISAEPEVRDGSSVFSANLSIRPGIEMRLYF